jgi:hypothetical protein
MDRGSTTVGPLSSTAVQSAQIVSGSSLQINNQGYRTQISIGIENPIQYKTKSGHSIKLSVIQ